MKWMHAWLPAAALGVVLAACAAAPPPGAATPTPTATPAVAAPGEPATAVGLLVPAGVSICQEETHWLDPRLEGIGYLKSKSVDLDAYVGKWVRVTGPVVGVECEVIDVEKLQVIVPQGDPPTAWQELVDSYRPLLGGKDAVLRAFRDRHLSRLPGGRAVVRLFYAGLPWLVEWTRSEPVAHGAGWLALAPATAAAEYAVRSESGGATFAGCLR